MRVPQSRRRGARETLAGRLAGAELRSPRLPVYANATARPYRESADEVRAGLAEQVAVPVRFVEQIEAMYAAGARVFVEAGPGGVLTDLVGRILRGRAHTAIACDRSGAPGLPSFLVALARLVAAGVSVDLEPLFAGRASAVDLASPERFAAPATAWVVDGGGARPLRGERPAFAMKPAAAPIAIAAPSDDRESVVREYLRTMREMVDGQRDVMLRYLGAQGDEPRPARAVQVSAPPAVVESAPTPAVAKELTPLAAVVATVCERTGYPADMLDPDLDLEADLGIDSIKRIEILGAVRDKLGLQVSGEGQNALVEQLSGVKTMRGIVAILEARLRGDAAPAAPPVQATPASPEAPRQSEPPVSQVERYVVDVDSTAPPTPTGIGLAGRTFAITRDALGVAERLVQILAGRSAQARVVEPGDALGTVDGLVHLATLGAESSGAVQELFVRAREATGGGARWIVAATGLGGRFGLRPGSRVAPPVAAGVSGLLKSLKKERPELDVRAIDLDPTEAVEQLAEHVLSELLADDGNVEVGYLAGERHTIVVAARPSSMPPPVPLTVDRESVVLLTGGARGITARVALAMARRFRCKLELVGRSPLPVEEEDAELRGRPRRALAPASPHRRA